MIRIFVYFYWPCCFLRYFTLSYYVIMVLAVNTESRSFSGWLSELGAEAEVFEDLQYVALLLSFLI